MVSMDVTGSLQSEGRSPDVSAIIVSYRTGDVLFECVDAVLSVPDVAELILVNHDNPAATVERLDELATRQAKLRLIHTGDNLGFSKGCNIGAAAATTDRFFFLNPDAVIQPGDAAQMARTLQGLAEPAIVGARLLDTTGQEQRGGRRDALTLPTALCAFLGMRDRFHRETEPLPDTAVPMPTVSGAAMIMSRAGFEALGGFDEGYFLHVEDIDICKRARDAGGEVMFEPRVAIRHVGSTSDVSKLQVELFKAMGLTRYFRKHGGVAAPVKAALLGPFFLLGAVARNLILRLKAGRTRRISPAE